MGLCVLAGSPALDRPGCCFHFYAALHSIGPLPPAPTSVHSVTCDNPLLSLLRRGRRAPSDGRKRTAAAFFYDAGCGIPGGWVGVGFHCTSEVGGRICPFLYSAVLMDYLESTDSLSTRPQQSLRGFH